MKKLLIFTIFFTLVQGIYAQKFEFKNSDWADSVFNSLTRQQRVAQLFMVDAFTDPSQDNIQKVAELIKKYGIGGVIFFKGTPIRQAYATNYLQSISPIPLLIGIDGEWGLSMRLDSTLKFPRQMGIGAIPDEKLLKEMGRIVARNCKTLGIHVNFAPDADINNNANNPVIGDRSFGEHKSLVTIKSLAYLAGMQEEGLLTTIKHFPGHGDTEIDSHEDLPTLKFDKTRLDTLELFPFKFLINHGANGVMVAHLNVPALDSSGKPASLSPKIINYLLKEKLGFKGLVFTDALNMKGVSKTYTKGTAELEALKAGADVLLYPNDIESAINLIINQMDSGFIDSNEVYLSVKKVLNAKYYAGLNNYKPINISKVRDELNKPNDVKNRNLLVEESITIVKNDDLIIPLSEGRDKKIACIATGFDESSPFQQSLSNYIKMDLFQISKNRPLSEFDSLYNKIIKNDYDLIIVSLHNTNRLFNKSYGLTEPQINFINQLSAKKKLALVSFGVPYNLNFFKNIETIVVGYQDDEINQIKAAQVMVGAIGAKGKLSVNVNEEFPLGTGVITNSNNKLKYGMPEDLGWRSTSWESLDKIVNDGIDAKAFPGAQLLVVKNNMVIYQKSFGYHRYDKKQAVKNSDIYDIASITKTMSTTLAVMKLYERGKINLDKKISYYLKDFRKTNKANITVRQLLTHTGGLISWIPFYTDLLSEDQKLIWLRKNKVGDFTIQLADSLWLNENYKDSMWAKIKSSPMGKVGNYVYSDLSFYILERIVEKVSGKKLDQYVEKYFYEPLDLSTMGYKPIGKFDSSRIVPTEIDTLFRKQELKGFVHDPGCAMFGGVAGNAGLFSNANDIAVISQMLLNGGEYAGITYFKKETVDLFTSKQFEDCRRGLGFDKPETRPGKDSPAAASAPAAVFGHSGFTGTIFWADPENDLIIVFLSNRVHPDAANKKISDLNIRTRIQEEVYKLIK